MTNYEYSAYGSNPNSGRNPNANLDWGNYCWPAGVPSSLLGTARYEDVSLTVRVELVELTTLLMQYTDQQGYDLRGTENTKAPPGNWCWGYSNRAISGTNSPSNHSKGKAVDLNAPANPYTSPLVCDIPPGIVNTWEKAGWFWGGRYSGSKDAMHFEYCWAKTDVAWDVEYVKSMLGNGEITPPKDWFDMATEADLRKIICEELDKRQLSLQHIHNDHCDINRADEFKLDADRRAQDVFRTVTEVLHSPEFDLGATRADTEQTQKDVVTILDLLK